MPRLRRPRRPKPYLPRRPKPYLRRALALLAGCGSGGCTEPVMRMHGFTADQLAEFPTATAGGADICGQTESLARIYWRPALRKSFAAFPADSKVA
jgi:hypothetical protein